MKFRFLLISFLAGLHPLHAQSYSTKTLKEIKAVENSLSGRIKIEGRPDHNIYDRMAYYNVKGVSIAVVHNYKVVWAKGYGWADEEEKRPVTPAILFEPGSISKSLNAVGVLKLVRDKKLDLYTDINVYLTSWKFPYDSVSKGRKITLAQLLSHSAGLTVHGFPGYDLTAPIPTVPQILDGTPPANTPAVRSLAAPGTLTKYSGGGTTIAQLVISDVTHQPYDVFMYEQVLKPIGMIHSFYTQPPPEQKRHLCASGYHADGSPVRHKFHVYPEQAAAGLWMTPSDLCNYIIEIQLAYQGKSAKVLNRKMTKLLLTPYNDKAAALGVFVQQYGNTGYFQHSAGNDGFSGQYFGSLEGGNGVAVFINSDNPDILPEIVNSVAQVYKWPDFYKPAYKKIVTVPEHTLRQYEGVYLYGNTWAIVLKKDSALYLIDDGRHSEMYLTSPGNFFATEFTAEGEFVTDDKGSVSGYKRKANDQQLQPARKITNADTLHLAKNQLNEIGWYLLENKNPVAATVYIRRGLELYPGDLLLLGNLAHCYLFSNRYDEAIAIYQGHLSEQITPYFTWQEMIQQDFLALKKAGYDTSIMKKVLAETDISIEGF